MKVIRAGNPASQRFFWSGDDNSNLSMGEEGSMSCNDAQIYTLIGYKIMMNSKLALYCNLYSLFSLVVNILTNCRYGVGESHSDLIDSPHRYKKGFVGDLTVIYTRPGQTSRAADL